MKREKILKIIIILILLFTTNKVSASTLTSETIDGVYGIFISDDYYSFAMSMYKMDDKIVYCIEPGTKITTHDYYNTSDLSMTNLSQDKINYIKLVAYYGYEYESHQDYYYYLAAQELIWEKVIEGSVAYYTTTQEVHGIKINIDSYKNEILRLMNSHSNTVSFNENKVSKLKDEIVTLNDRNNLLSSYEVIEGQASILDNNLIIDGNDSKITLRKKLYTTDVFLLYYNNNSQKMVSSGVVDDVLVNVYIDITGVDLTINKYGEDFIINEEGYSYNKIPLANIEFSLYAKDDIVTSDNVIHYKSGDLIDNLTTDNYGNIRINLYLGSYCLVEVKSNVNYRLDNEDYCFDLKDNNTIEIYNYLKKGNINIVKKDSNTNDVIEGTVIGIYDINNNLIMKAITDNYGEINFSNLPLGRYYVKEIEASEGYILSDNKIYFDLLEDNKTIKIDFTNDKIVEIPITGINTYNISWLIVIINLIGVFLIKYAIKKI